MQVCRRGEVTRVKASHERGSHRVVQHRGQEAALNETGRIYKRLAGSERDLDRSVLRADGNELPAERDRRGRKRHPAFHGVPERAYAPHASQHCARL